MAAIIVAGLVMAGCTAPESSPTPTPTPVEIPAVALTLSDAVDGPVRIGLIVPPVDGEGSEARLFVGGAGVGVNRFVLSGEDVSVATVLDNGSAAGADHAMQSLIDDGVAGVVMAASGEHTSQALATAAAARMPVIMVYGQPVGAVDGVWSIAPTSEQIAATLARGLSDAGADSPILVATDPSSPLVVDLAPVAWLDPADPTVAATVAAGIQGLTVDSVVIDAPPLTQARIVGELQGVLGDRQIPIMLAPQALTPVFSQALVSTGASSVPLMSAGVNADDLASLTHGEQADAAAAFFAALRLGANDPGCRNVYDDDSCASAALWADIPSHDALVALVRGVEQAGSTDPGAVARALGTLSLGADDGLAGPGLDFTTTPVLADSSVVVLHSATVDPGIRSSVAGEERVFWFAEVAQ